jgi:chorismate dehydratase
MMKKLIIGSVPYMNATPLTRWFETPEGREAAEIRLAVPSVLAQWLTAREVDVALVSSVEAFRQKNTVIVPGIAIASEREVMSVRLFSKVPFERLKQVALDSGSLTSTALIRVLLRELYGAKPLYVSAPPDLNRMLAECEAGLLIGDNGMAASAEGLSVMDLGAAWYQLTGLPFVWAVWLANAETDLERLTTLLHRAKAWGLAHLEELVGQEAERMGLNPALCRHYLHEIIVYDLAPPHLQGLELFKTYLENENHGLDTI